MSIEGLDYTPEDPEIRSLIGAFPVQHSQEPVMSVTERSEIFELENFLDPVTLQKLREIALPVLSDVDSCLRAMTLAYLEEDKPTKSLAEYLEYEIGMLYL